MNDARTAAVRVAVVIPRYAPIFGGAENQARLLVRTMTQRRDVSVSVILTRRHRLEDEPLEHLDGVPVMRLGSPGLSRWREYRYYVRVLTWLLRHRGTLDVFHCHATSVLGAVVTLAGLMARRPVVLKLSSNGELVSGLRSAMAQGSISARILRNLRRPLVRLSARNAYIVALNREGAQELATAGATHARVINNGVDTAHFRPAPLTQRAERRRAMGIRDDEFVVAFSGRFVVRKGIDTLVAAHSMMRADPNLRDVSLLMIGGTDLQDDAVRIDPSEPGVRVVASVPDVLSVLQIADAFAFPSRREGMPNAVLEAMAIGLPCILSDIEPHKELSEVVGGVGAFLFRTGDAADLVAAVRRCRANPTPSAEIARKIQQHFAVETVAQRYAALYRDAMAGRP